MIFRTLGILLTYRLRSRLPLLGVSRLRLRVRPGDLDLNLHMNNGRFFSVADLGRFDHGLRSRLWAEAFKRRWRPMAGDSDGRFSASLQPFRRFALETRLLGWDAKWFFSEHRFLQGSRVAAVVVVRYVFAGARGVVPTTQVLEAIGHTDPSPTLPDWVLQWRDAQDALVRNLKQEAATRSPQ